MNYLSHLECGMCGETFDPDCIRGLCPKCSKPFLARYDLDAARLAVDIESVSRRRNNIWRFHELMPVRSSRHRLTLGEGCTPLNYPSRLAASLDFENLYIKDESVNPTGSFKARGLCAAVSKAAELGAIDLSIPSAGNAAGAMSAYAAAAGMRAHVFMPKDVPVPFITECRALGASVTLVDGLISDCGKKAAAEAAGTDRYDMSTLKEPYRLEGKKTIGYELAEDFNWELPDVIIYPTGGGTGLIGMWKAFSEMEALGWIGSQRPRMVSVQSDGCAPIVKAFENGGKFAEPWHNAKTLADGLRVPSAVGDFLILSALRESGGTAVAVSDAEIMTGSRLISLAQGIFTSPEGGAALAAFQKLRQRGWIEGGEKVVLFVTGGGHKYYHLYA